jgi:hypothetical protein
LQHKELKNKPVMYRSIAVIFFAKHARDRVAYGFAIGENVACERLYVGKRGGAGLGIELWVDWVVLQVSWHGKTAFRKAAAG